MQDQKWIIENDIRKVQQTKNCLRGNLEHNKRERLRKCREAGILDHWRRQQKNKSKHHGYSRMISLSTPISASSNAFNNHSFNQDSRDPPSKRCEENEFAESLDRRHSQISNDTIKRMQTQDSAASHVVLQNNREFHNDYSQHFVDSGNRPQNYIRSTSLVTRFNE